MDYKERLLHELLGLNTKKARLDVYLENVSGRTVDDKNNIELMNRQLAIMSEYECVLIERIHLEMNRQN